MNLGKNHLALAVKDIAASYAFYQKLGFEALPNCGSIEDKWLIVRNGNIQLGLYQDMFSKNVITFNPPDVRAVQQALQSRGITLSRTCDENSSGPAYIMLKDPDGNEILMDQH
ncbi:MULTISPECIES: VOC family protein [Roseivirga]|jgi:predicted lactoylglutathione lyase|uniref:VOC domain-containing protein n=1 Tax=Roseivirga thermotolerans TaxID=1758176 RepID=A0ABQ3I3A5_9BACT|nr:MULTISPECIES: VOC family protein [Roseivirga]MEC7756114.1 VOC family protein [Bacteroidota bacterium]GHE50617.1 hypothetical protein GCM10011340_00690 [Roseivirga thermotolerans]|tara:strand:- start:2813 stop:3151 length:339 start_codon:yes stop_codon:yes gene_type:complete